MERRPARGGCQRAALADAAASVTVVVQLGGGFSLLLGIEPRLGALLLLRFLYR
jgi:uncharacterized membrane protein YphA (DoxX/SURF4 family)